MNRKNKKTLNLKPVIQILRMFEQENKKNEKYKNNCLHCWGHHRKKACLPSRSVCYVYYVHSTASAASPFECKKSSSFRTIGSPERPLSMIPSALVESGLKNEVKKIFCEWIQRFVRQLSTAATHERGRRWFCAEPPRRRWTCDLRPRWGGACRWFIVGASLEIWTTISLK